MGDQNKLESLTLVISLGTSRITLKLASDRQIIDLEVFSYYHDLDVKLINHLDRLLKRNKIDIHSVKSYKILSDQGEKTTSHKIVEAVVCGLKVTLY